MVAPPQQPPELIERIYEAAFDPAQWRVVLGEVCRLSGTASGSLMVYQGRDLLSALGTELNRDPLEEFIRTKGWERSERHPDIWPPSMPDGGYFFLPQDLMTPDQLARDASQSLLLRHGLDWQIATSMLLPTGETLAFTFESLKSDRRPGAATLAFLNAVRPHLARAGLLASRLGLERARAALAALTALDLPAGLLDARGRLLEANARLTPALVDTRAGGRIVLGYRAADAMLEALLSGATRVRSIALPPNGERPARVAHVIPLAPAVRDPLSSAVALLVLSVAGAARAMVTDLSLLQALFDLSAAEGRLAAALATGLDLAQAAQQCGIATSTARSYLEKIFQKTGCHRQSELVLLLAGLVSLPRVGDTDGAHDGTGAAPS